MAQNFEGMFSSDELWYGNETQTRLTDVIDGKADVNHTHDGYAAADHSHAGYAATDHSHSGFAAAEHSHTPEAIGAAPASHAHEGYAASNHGHSYNDLTDKPSIPEGYTHPDTHPASMISGLATVASSGSYDDLSDKPTIPTVPTSLPANGGNADTVGGKAASEFAPAEHNHNGYAPANHSHTEYAEEDHTHSDYAAATHSHDGYAPANHSHTVDAALSPSSTNPIQNKVVNDALGGKAPTSHVSTDGEYGVSTALAYGHAKASGTTPKAPGTAAVGSETGSFARGDHVHPDQEMMRGITTGGTGAAYTATVAGIEVLAAGVSFVMVPHVVSTAVTPTLNVNGLGAKPIRRRLSNSTISTVPAEAENWLGANKPVRMIYDGAFWIAGEPRPNAADIYGTLPVEKGGTGVTTLAQLLEALVALGVVPSTGGTFNGAVTIKPQLYTAQMLPFDGGSYSIGSGERRYYSTYLRVNPNVSSDRRCKRDIYDMDIAALAAFVDNLKVVSYNYNDDAEDADERIGLIAQDVVAADPDIAKGCVEQDEKGFYSLRAADLVYPLIAAVQALTKRVEELEGK